MRERKNTIGGPGERPHSRQKSELTSYAQEGKKEKLVTCRSRAKKAPSKERRGKRGRSRPGEPEKKARQRKNAKPVNRR